MNTILLRELKELAIRDHYYNDEWYSCPKCPTGCDDESQGDECNCGAEEHNKKVNEIYSKISKNIKKFPKRCDNCLNCIQNRGIGGKCKIDNTKIENPFKTVCKENYQAKFTQYL